MLHRRRARRGLPFRSLVVVVLLLCAFLFPNALVVHQFYSQAGYECYALAQGVVVLALAMVPAFFLHLRGWLLLHGVLLFLLPIALTSWFWIGEPLNYAVYSAIRTTDLSEVWGQLQGYQLSLWGYLGGMVLYFALLFLFVPRGYRLFRHRRRAFGLVLVVSLVASPFIVTHRPDAGAGWSHYWERQYFSTLKGLFNGAFPFDILRHTIAFQKAQSSEEEVLSSRQIAFSEGVSLGGEAPILGVLVIGETSRACNWQLGGYWRPTTPLLSRRCGIHYFTNAYAGSNYTLLSAPMLISAATPHAPEAWRSSPFITEVLAQGNVRTGWVASQSTQSAWARVAMAACDYVRTIDFSFPHSIPLDEKLLPHAREFIDSTRGHGLLVVHTYGGHFNYRDRYTEPYAYFSPALGKSVAEMMKVDAGDREELLNSFDNTIAYTDMVLDSIARYLERRGGNSFMLYTADHGENLFDEVGVGHLHASAKPTHYEAHVPYLVWLSDSYRRTYPMRDSTLAAHRDLPIDHTSTFHTLLDLLGVDYKGKERSRCLSDSGYRPSARWILNPSSQLFPAPPSTRLCP